MEKRKAKFDFRLMNSLGQLKDEEFKVAYFILNAIGMNDGKRTKIYRAAIAEWTGKSEKTISRITDRLNEQGVIKKDLVSNGIKTSNYYGYGCPQTEQNLDTDGQQTTQNLDTDVPLNKIYNIDKIEKMNKIENMNNIEKISKPKNQNELTEYFRIKIKNECKDKNIEELNEIQMRLKTELDEFSDVIGYQNVFKYFVIPAIEKEMENAQNKLMMEMVSASGEATSSPN